jgi:uncharacterized protein YndB with AHSA1/START domain
VVVKKSKEDFLKNHEVWHEVRIKASPEAVYLGLTDVKRLEQWWI